MNLEIYCDESCQDVFTSQHTKCRYMFIGGLWLPAEKREIFKNELHAIREKHKMFSEIKWNKISLSKINFYIDLINYFFDKNDDLRFPSLNEDISYRQIPPPQRRGRGSRLGDEGSCREHGMKRMTEAN